MAKLIHFIRKLFNIPICNTYAWTDSTVIIGWVAGDPCRFKIFVGNRVSELVNYVPPERWRHVSGVSNPADCASRGLLPSELLEHNLWWNGPEWLHEKPENWPEQKVVPIRNTEEEKNVCLATTLHIADPIVPFDRYSSYTKLKMVAAWMFRFIKNVSKKRREHIDI